jgi:hypothetical protein
MDAHEARFNTHNARLKSAIPTVLLCSKRARIAQVPEQAWSWARTQERCGFSRDPHTSDPHHLRGEGQTLGSIQILRLGQSSQSLQGA